MEAGSKHRALRPVERVQLIRVRRGYRPAPGDRGVRDYTEIL